MNVGKFMRILQCYFKANRIIANYPNKKAVRNRVNLWELDLQEHWNSDRFGSSNLGDYLARVIVEYMLSLRGLSLETEINKTRHLNSIGSNILLSFQDATIWGSGIERRDDSYKRINTLHSRPFRKLDVRAVRGPLTRDYLMELGHYVPPVYGDPAILMPLIYNPEVGDEEAGFYEYIIVPQYYTEKDIREKYPNEKIVSMMTSDYKDVIDQIKRSKKVITSSLHGIVLSECYGVPAVFYRGLNESIDFKYKDYYYSTNRFDFPIAVSLEEALSIEPLPVPDLGGLRQGLLDSFPYDLWQQ